MTEATNHPNRWDSWGCSYLLSLMMEYQDEVRRSRQQMPLSAIEGPCSILPFMISNYTSLRSQSIRFP